jgi:hypothetical protein
MDKGDDYAVVGAVQTAAIPGFQICAPARKAGCCSVSQLDHEGPAVAGPHRSRRSPGEVALVTAANSATAGIGVNAHSEGNARL